ncbi:hypothetical protein QTP88_002616 [Uroleucon formosanum]
MHKRKYQCGADKRKAKQKEELKKCANDQRQKKLCFIPQTEDNNILDKDKSVQYSKENCADNNIQQSASFNLSSLAFFIRPPCNETVEVKLAFLKNHPIQPSVLINDKLSFDPNKVYYQNIETTDDQNQDKIPRKWLSYCSYTKKIYCTTCMAFSPIREKISNLISGLNVTNSKNTYNTLKIHELSQTHREAVSALLRANLKKSIDNCIDFNLKEIHSKEVEHSRLVIKRLIDIVLFIGRQGISFRGKDEAAYSLEDKSVNHGNFLELVMLLKDYDVVLNEHVKKCIELSKKRKEKAMKEMNNKFSQVHGHGRGSLVTFLSKTFINKLILAIGQIMQESIVNEIKQAQIFSILVDSTQDVAVLDQLAICVRYTLKNNIYEKLLKLTIAHDSTGIGLFNLIASEFSKLNIDMSKIVGCSFDGAANMKGAYNGLQYHLKSINPLCIYTHCYGHALNLVMVDSTECCQNAEMLFGLVQQSATFLSDSHKRIKIWSDLTKKTHKCHDKLRKLNLIGATRWWSKDKALNSIIQFNEPNIENSRFLLFIHFLLQIISKDSKFDTKTKFTARNLLKLWSKFEVIFTAVIFIDIFSVSSPVSTFLQSRSLNYLTAFNMTKTLLYEIKKRRDNSDQKFNNLHSDVHNFIQKINNALELNGNDFMIKDDFSKKCLEKVRVAKKKKMPGELAADERPSLSTENRFKVETYNYILDVMTSSIEKRFISNSELLKDCICLDPKNFKSIKNGLPDNSLVKLGELTNIGVHILASELHQFAIQFDAITKTFNETMSDIDDQYHDYGSDSEREQSTKESLDCKVCNNCLRCAFNILYDMVQQSCSFNNIYYAYKFVLILPCTQVTCERTFSKLKNIKTKLRSLISQDIMETLLLINIERDFIVDKDMVINNVAKSSTELTRILF